MRFLLRCLGADRPRHDVSKPHNVSPAVAEKNSGPVDKHSCGRPQRFAPDAGKAQHRDSVEAGNRLLQGSTGVVQIVADDDEGDKGAGMRRSSVDAHRTSLGSPLLLFSIPSNQAHGSITLKLQGCSKPASCHPVDNLVAIGPVARNADSMDRGSSGSDPTPAGFMPGLRTGCVALGSSTSAHILRESMVQAFLPQQPLASQALPDLQGDAPNLQSHRIHSSSKLPLPAAASIAASLHLPASAATASSAMVPPQPPPCSSGAPSLARLPHNSFSDAHVSGSSTRYCSCNGSAGNGNHNHQSNSLHDASHPHVVWTGAAARRQGAASGGGGGGYSGSGMMQGQMGASARPHALEEVASLVTSLAGVRGHWLEALAEAVARAAELLGADSVSVYLLSESGATHTPMACHGDAGGAVRLGLPLPTAPPSGHPPTALQRLYATGEPQRGSVWSPSVPPPHMSAPPPSSPSRPSTFASNPHPHQHTHQHHSNPHHHNIGNHHSGPAIAAAAATVTTVTATTATGANCTYPSSLFSLPHFPPPLQQQQQHPSYQPPPPSYAPYAPLPLPPDWHAMRALGGMTDFVAVPLRRGEAVIGVLQVVDRCTPPEDIAGAMPPSRRCRGTAELGLVAAFIGTMLVDHEVLCLLGALEAVAEARDVDGLVRALARHVALFCRMRKYIAPGVRVALIRDDAAAMALFLDEGATAAAASGLGGGGGGATAPTGTISRHNTVCSLQAMSSAAAAATLMSTGSNIAGGGGGGTANNSCVGNARFLNTATGGGRGPRRSGSGLGLTGTGFDRGGGGSGVFDVAARHGGAGGGCSVRGNLEGGANCTTETPTATVTEVSTVAELWPWFASTVASAAAVASGAAGGAAAAVGGSAACASSLALTQTASVMSDESLLAVGGARGVGGMTEDAIGACGVGNTVAAAAAASTHSPSAVLYAEGGSALLKSHSNTGLYGSALVATGEMPLSTNSFKGQAVGSGGGRNSSGQVQGHAMLTRGTVLAEALAAGTGMYIADVAYYMQDARNVSRDVFLAPSGRSGPAQPTSSLAVTVVSFGGSPLAGLYITFGSPLPASLLNALISKVHLFGCMLGPLLHERFHSEDSELADEWRYLLGEVLDPRAIQSAAEEQRSRRSSAAAYNQQQQQQQQQQLQQLQLQQQQQHKEQQHHPLQPPPSPHPPPPSPQHPKQHTALRLTPPSPGKAAAVGVAVIAVNGGGAGGGGGCADGGSDTLRPDAAGPHGTNASHADGGDATAADGGAGGGVAYGGGGGGGPSGSTSSPPPPHPACTRSLRQRRSPAYGSRPLPPSSSLSSLYLPYDRVSPSGLMPAPPPSPSSLGSATSRAGPSPQHPLGPHPHQQPHAGRLAAAAATVSVTVGSSLSAVAGPSPPHPTQQHYNHQPHPNHVNLEGPQQQQQQQQQHRHKQLASPGSFLLRRQLAAASMWSSTAAAASTPRLHRAATDGAAQTAAAAAKAVAAAPPCLLRAATESSASGMGITATAALAAVAAAGADGGSSGSGGGSTGRCVAMAFKGGAAGAESPAASSTKEVPSHLSQHQLLLSRNCSGSEIAVLSVTSSGALGTGAPPPPSHSQPQSPSPLSYCCGVGAIVPPLAADAGADAAAAADQSEATAADKRRTNGGSDCGRQPPYATQNGNNPAAYSHSEGVSATLEDAGIAAMPLQAQQQQPPARPGHAEWPALPPPQQQALQLSQAFPTASDLVELRTASTPAPAVPPADADNPLEARPGLQDAAAGAVMSPGSGGVRTPLPPPPLPYQLQQMSPLSGTRQRTRSTSAAGIAAAAAAVVRGLGGGGVAQSASQVELPGPGPLMRLLPGAGGGVYGSGGGGGLGGSIGTSGSSHNVDLELSMQAWHLGCDPLRTSSAAYARAGSLSQYLTSRNGSAGMHTLTIGPSGFELLTSARSVHPCNHNLNPYPAVPSPLASPSPGAAAAAVGGSSVPYIRGCSVNGTAAAAPPPRPLGGMSRLTTVASAGSAYVASAAGGGGGGDLQQLPAGVGRGGGDNAAAIKYDRASPVACSVGGAFAAAAAAAAAAAMTPGPLTILPPPVIRRLRGSVRRNTSFNIMADPGVQDTGKVAPLMANLQDKLRSLQAGQLLARLHDKGESGADELSGLTILEPLGSGGFGTVFRGIFNGIEVAVKVLCERGSGGRSEAATMREAFELAVMTTLSHPHIVQVLSAFTDVILTCQPDSRGGPHCTVLLPRSRATEELGEPTVAIAMEYCDAGSLADAVAEGRLRERVPGGYGALQPCMPAIYATLLEIALALRHMHAMLLVHCDLKPANILLKSNMRDPRGFSAKLSDFGLVKMMVEDGSGGGGGVIGRDARTGTVTHMAPELIRATEASKMDASVDVYAFGVLMWELLSCAPVYLGLSSEDIRRGVAEEQLRPDFPPWADARYRALAESCLSSEPRSRPTSAALVAQLRALLAESGALQDTIARRPAARAAFRSPHHHFHPNGGPLDASAAAAAAAAGDQHQQAYGGFPGSETAAAAGAMLGIGPSEFCRPSRLAPQPLQPCYAPCYQQQQQQQAYGQGGRRARSRSYSGPDSSTFPLHIL